MTYRRIFILFRILSLILLFALVYGSAAWAATELIGGMGLRSDMTTAQRVATMVSILVVIGCMSWCMKLVLDRLVDAGVTLMSTTQQVNSDK